ncbi:MULTISPECIES: hypothetical protein [Clostridium]|uniref:hypothetical protein n=1 Tax=Clostridium TaxID=1485 RepID=UPI0025849EEC|nr:MULTISPECIES: hypothetical protein [Clostridium]MDU4849779.1 hypothetical protein [Clostridium sp.]CAI3192868.1 hypothetical protein CNEO2_130050 [Clostridium neonatale]CAI3202701.1 hypothetical protein CNEO2_260050 [Clostridium neonatale]CAI3594532.1 hypothetical protein CNEO4_210051 [Clostridium neonatale]
MWYDPYVNRLGKREELSSKEQHFLVPLIFTQSGTKPMTLIEMSKQYVKMYDEFKDSFHWYKKVIATNGEDLE